MLRKIMSCGEMRSKICYVETFLHMINVQTNLFVAIYAVLSRNLLCCHLCCIYAKSILSQFTHFCVEKNLLRNCACGEKRTNMRYDFMVWLVDVFSIFFFGWYFPCSVLVFPFIILQTEAGWPFWYFLERRRSPLFAQAARMSYPSLTKGGI